MPEKQCLRCKAPIEETDWSSFGEFTTYGVQKLAVKLRLYPDFIDAGICKPCATLLSSEIVKAVERWKGPRTVEDILRDA